MKMLGRISAFVTLISSVYPAYAENPCEPTWNLNIGNHQVVSDYLVENSRFADESKKIVSVGVYGQGGHDFLVVTQPGTHAEKVVDPFPARNYPGTQIHVSADGNFAVFVAPMKFQVAPVIYDVQGDRFRKLKDFAKASDVWIVKNSRYAVAKLPDLSVGIYSIETGRLSIVKVFKDDWDMNDMGTSNQILLNADNGFARILNLDTLVSDKVQLPSRVMRSQSSLDGQTLLLYGKFDQGREALYLYDVKNKVAREVNLESPTEVQLLPSGRALLYVQTSSPHELRILDFESGLGNSITSNYGEGYNVSFDGSDILIRDQSQALQLYNAHSKKLVSLDLGIGAQVLEFNFGKYGQSAYLQYAREGRYYFGIYSILSRSVREFEVPFNSSPLVSADERNVLFAFDDLDEFRGGTTILYDLKQLSLQTQAGKIPRSMIESRFSYLAKPGKFKVARNLNEVLYFFESGMFKKHRVVAQKILMNVLSESIGLYESIVGRYPEFSQDGGFFADAERSVLPEAWKRGVKRYLDYFVATRANVDSIVDSIKYMRPVHNYLAWMTGDQLEIYADALTEAVADAAHQEFDKAFKSELYKLCEEYIYPIFWIPYRTVTDNPYDRLPYQVVRTVFSSEPTGGMVSTKTKYGFYVNHVDTVQIPRDAKPGDVIVKDQKITWTVGKDVYESTWNIVVQAESIDPVTPELKSFSLAKYRKDGVLSGTVMVGSNLAAEDAGTIESYLNFFRKAGYVQQRSKSVNDLKSFFKEQVSSGKMDYIVFEAHSDGDATNVIRINARDKILTLNRSKHGKVETVNIIVPSGKPLADYTDPTRTALVSNQELAEWIKTRDAAGYPPLLIIRTNCWSVSKMVNEIEAVNSKGLQEVASLSPVTFFDNSKDNAEVILLNNFFAGKMFRKYREQMSGNASYAHKNGNNFIFPDDDDYQHYIRDVIKPVLYITHPITKNGKPYAIDE